MTTPRSGRLDELTVRWRERHDARRAPEGARPRADVEREALAARSFPYQTVTPGDYVTEYGDAMAGFTYDDARYADPELDAWLLEVGRLVRARHESGGR